jgi:hypothetical protein
MTIRSPRAFVGAWHMPVACVPLIPIKWGGILVQEIHALNPHPLEDWLQHIEVTG